MHQYNVITLTSQIKNQQFLIVFKKKLEDSLYYVKQCAPPCEGKGHTVSVQITDQQMHKQTPISQS